jgi:hypothetical protein
MFELRRTIALPLVLVLAAGCQTPRPQEEFRYWENRTQVEFYISGREQPAPKYRVRSFHLEGQNQPQLAGRFHGLAARDLENGTYEYVLEPEVECLGLHFCHNG